MFLSKSFSHPLLSSGPQSKRPGPSVLPRSRLEGIVKRKQGAEVAPLLTPAPVLVPALIPAHPAIAIIMAQRRGGTDAEADHDHHMLPDTHGGTVPWVRRKKTCLSKTATLPDMFLFIFEIMVTSIWICYKFLEKSTF